MRLSPRRVLLRVALLVVGGGYMLVRAAQLRRAALDAGAPAEGRLALAWALVGVLALLAAASAALALRRRPARRTLRLGDLTGSADSGEAARSRAREGPAASGARERGTAGPAQGSRPGPPPGAPG